MIYIFSIMHILSLLAVCSQNIWCIVDDMLSIISHSDTFLKFMLCRKCVYFVVFAREMIVYVRILVYRPVL